MIVNLVLSHRPEDLETDGNAGSILPSSFRPLPQPIGGADTHNYLETFPDQATIKNSFPHFWTDRKYQSSSDTPIHSI